VEPFVVAHSPVLQSTTKTARHDLISATTSWCRATRCHMGVRTTWLGADELQAPAASQFRKFPCLWPDLSNEIICFPGDRLALRFTEHAPGPAHGSRASGRGSACTGGTGDGCWRTTTGVEQD